jgi:hypothetical protein
LLVPLIVNLLWAFLTAWSLIGSVSFHMRACLNRRVLECIEVYFTPRDFFSYLNCDPGSG